jgi:hypothetical protein
MIDFDRPLEDEQLSDAFGFCAYCGQELPEALAEIESKQ